MQGLHERHLDFTTAGDGTATVLDTQGGITGWLYAVRWVDGDLADGVGAVLSVTETRPEVDYTLLTLTGANDDAWYYPRVVANDAAGVAQTANDTMLLIMGRLKLAVTAGGDTKSGSALVYYFE